MIAPDSMVFKLVILQVYVMFVATNAKLVMW